jgi:DNA-directed RNA polymerase specialized sigma24 family protein
MKARRKEAQGYMADAEPRRRALEESSAPWLVEVLGAWQAPEVRIARGFPECRGLSTEELEDLFQDTVEALLGRSYLSEDHLRHALRIGIKSRALNQHRNERRRREILNERAAEMYAAWQAREDENGPERAVIAEQDRLIVCEFKTELTEVEQRVFARLLEGLQYRAIATVEGIDVNAARRAARACERKRERFQLLYDTGRLCGFRAGTILALQSGKATSETLAERAFAHLERCPYCRAEHKTNARRLRRSFQDQAIALLPLPGAVHRLGLLTRFDLRARLLVHRLTTGAIPTTPGVRERAATLLAGTGASAKVAAGVATVAVIATGAIGATHVLNHHPPAPHRHSGSALHAAIPAKAGAASSSRSQQLILTPTTVRTPPARPNTSTQTVQQPSSTPTVSRAAANYQASTRPAAPASQPTGQHEPGGFAYLGVPASKHAEASAAPAESTDQHGGGPFSP